MSQHLFANNANSTLNGSLSAGQTNLPLQTGQGARFPSPAGADYFNVTIDDGTNIEVCRCYNRSTDTLNVVRGVEGTTAVSFSSGAKVELRLTVEDLDWVTELGKVGFVSQLPNANGASFTAIGAAGPTTLGSLQSGAPNYHAGEYNRSMPFVGLTCGNSAGYGMEMRSGITMLNGVRGFKFTTRFGFLAAQLVNSMHFFIGLCNTNGQLASAYPPSSVSGGIVLGFVNSGVGANFSIWRADSGGTATQTDLGSYFTCASGAWYEFSVTAPSLQGTFVTRVKRLDVGSIADAVNTYTTSCPMSYDLGPYLKCCILQNSAPYIMIGGWHMKSGG